MQTEIKEISKLANDLLVRLFAKTSIEDFNKLSQLVSKIDSLEVKSWFYNFEKKGEQNV